MVVIKQNITYDSDNDLKVDIYFPNNTSSQTKILIFWHGGGWIKGSKEGSKELGIKFANAGFMTLIPDYTLAQTAKFPAAHNDAKKFVDWLLTSKYTDDDDQKNIVQVGASAGGTMALMIAGKYGFPTVTWSAPVDFVNWFAHHQEIKPSLNAASEFNYQDQDKINSSFYKYFTLTYIDGYDHKKLKLLDPINYNYQNLGPLLMINSAQELTPISGVYTYLTFLANHNHEVQLTLVPGHGHAMAYALDYLNESINFLYQSMKRI